MKKVLDKTVEKITQKHFGESVRELHTTPDMYLKDKMLVKKDDSRITEKGFYSISREMIVWGFIAGLVSALVIFLILTFIIF